MSDYDDMPAGQAMDMKIHSRVMALTNIMDMPRYSTDIAVAWMLVQKMNERPGAYFELSFLRNRGTVTDAPWSAEFFGGKQVRADADTAPLAICRAALKVVGVGDE